MTCLMTTSTTRMENTDSITLRLKYSIIQNINTIKEDYTVIELIIDGHDEFGFKKMALCKNEHILENWEVPQEIENSINKYKKKIIENGIEFDGVTYYIDPYSFIYNNDVSLISEEEYNENKKNMEHMNIIMDKYINYLYEFHKNVKIKSKNKYFINFYYYKKLLNNAILINFDIFVISLKNILKSTYYSIFSDDFKYNIQWDDEDLKYIQFEKI